MCSYYISDIKSFKLTRICSKEYSLGSIVTYKTAIRFIRSHNEYNLVLILEMCVLIYFFSLMNL